MGDTSTAVRDPVFFRWHKFIDDTFVQHKVTLDPYTKHDLAFGGITVTSASIDDADSKVSPHVCSVGNNKGLLTKQKCPTH